VADLGGTEKFPGENPRVSSMNIFIFFIHPIFASPPPPLFDKGHEAREILGETGMFDGENSFYRKQINSSSSPHTHLHGK